MSFVFACNSDELAADSTLGVLVDNIPVLLVRYDDKLYAVKDECSHACIALSAGNDIYPIENGGCAVECGAHGAAFDLSSGAAIELPATKPIDVYPVREANGIIEVDLEK